MLCHSGVIRDNGMVYWDVRPSRNFPTIEVRVADVPATVAESVTFAALVRGCVMTALEEHRRGEPVQPLASFALKAAYWKAARDGLDGDSLDLQEHAPAPTRQLLEQLIDRVRPALEQVGDYELVSSGLAGVAERGNGAMRQQAAWRRNHEVSDVLAEAAAATLESPS